MPIRISSGKDTVSWRTTPCRGKRLARRAMWLAACATLIGGNALGEEPSGVWIVTPIAPRQLGADAEAWLHNSATGELFFCYQSIPKETKTTAGGVCLPTVRIPLGPIGSSGLTAPQTPQKSR